MQDKLKMLDQLMEEHPALAEEIGDLQDAMMELPEDEEIADEEVMEPEIEGEEDMGMDMAIEDMDMEAELDLDDEEDDEPMPRKKKKPLPSL